MDKDWLNWLAQVMPYRPKGNAYLDSERGMEIGRVCLDFEKQNFNWRRSDPDTFWVDVQLFTKYKLSNEEVEFVLKMQAGIENHKEYADERKAYAEMMRGIEKLRNLMKGDNY